MAWPLEEQWGLEGDGDTVLGRTWHRGSATRTRLRAQAREAAWHGVQPRRSRAQVTRRCGDQA